MRSAHFSQSNILRLAKARYYIDSLIAYVSYQDTYHITQQQIMSKDVL